MNSYHIFYFPFKWQNQKIKAKLLAEQTELAAIPVNPYTNWSRSPEPLNETEKEQLYNEKNFFYEFVHPVLYDSGKKDSIIYHYERIEPQQQDVNYIISVKDKTYQLKVEAIIYITLIIYTNKILSLSHNFKSNILWDER